MSVHSDAKSVSIPVPDMSALIARLESAEAGSRELDWAVGAALFTGVRGCAAPNATTSIDAALSLMDRVLPDWDWQITKGADEMALVSIAPSCKVCGPEVCAPTPSVALCIAILKAKAQGEGG